MLLWICLAGFSLNISAVGHSRDGNTSPPSDRWHKNCWKLTYRSDTKSITTVKLTKLSIWENSILRKTCKWISIPTLSKIFQQRVQLLALICTHIYLYETSHFVRSYTLNISIFLNICTLIRVNQFFYEFKYFTPFPTLYMHAICCQLNKMYYYQSPCTCISLSS